ncbi:hypothetical protein GQG93_004687 [Salmonella enterica]|nr:hypothetical protein [Salmonella enterica]EDW4109216.1 hypothetical protein [Salmonella enterica subsp. enterica serovar Oranienburg]EGK9738786.1 hypothetical protein [Salmonella enterica]EGM5024676.1 hypothetical protein [Salmonella enterica]EGT2460445.1 hypothetical protein [Salmonella enterica subsp. enterica serovar Oranienburg]
MALKTQLDSLDGLPEHIAGLYIPTEDGRYKLDVEQPEPTERRLSASIAEAELVRLLDASGANGFLLAPHLAERVKAVVDDSGAVKIEYYSENGNPQTVEQFKKDVLNNPRFSRLVTGSKAGGMGGYVDHGAAGHQQENPRLDITGGRLTRARNILANGSR